MSEAITDHDLRYGPVTIPPDAWMRLRTAGDLVANCALMASRTKGLPLSPRALLSLAECSAEWDAAKEAVHEFLQRPKQATGWGSPGPIADGG